MTRRTITAVLAAAVATSGTFTVSYPTGLNAGNFKHGKRHRMVAMQSEFEAPKHFTISFGATTATITWLGTTTIPAGSTVYVELDMFGSSTPIDAGEEGAIKRCTMFRTLLVDFGAPSASDAVFFFAAATLADGTALTLLQSTMPGGIPRNVIITNVGNDSGDTYVIAGQDEYGNTMSETITGANAGVAAGKKAFYKVTGVDPSGASAGNVSVGYGDVLGLPVYLRDDGEILTEFVNNAKVSGFSGTVALPWELEQTQLLAPTAETLVSPVAGRIARVRTQVQAAVTTGGVITAEVNTVAVDGISITIADAAAAGATQVDTPTAGHASAVVAAGDDITITPSAAFATAGEINGTVEIEPTNQMNGTLVVGDVLTATATTGDVRGTYDPALACDGTTAFALLVAIPDPSYKGAPQFAG